MIQDDASPVTWTADEMMTVSAARLLRGDASCFVGIGLPSTAANLARLTHAPDLKLVYESGPVGAKPTRLPLSIGDGELSLTADAVLSVPEIFNYWLQPGRIDIGFLTAAQIDRWGNLNTTVLGDSYDRPDVRLPGAGGAPEIASHCREVIIVMRHRKRSFAEKIDFVTSVGFGSGLGDRERLGLAGAGPRTLITDLGILKPDPHDCELTLVAVHPGVALEEVLSQTGWAMRVHKDLTTTPAPTAVELRVLRDLISRSS